MDETRNMIDADETAGPSPFGPRKAPVEPWIKLATWTVGVAIVAVAAFIGWSYYNDVQLSRTQSATARAVSNLSNIVAKNPSNATARVRLAEAMIANDQQSEAILQLQEALKIDKENVAALSDLGLIAMDRKEWKKAEEYWIQLIDLLSADQMSSKDQRLAEVYYFLGTTFVEERRYEEAVANLKESIAIKRDSSPVHYMLSVAYQRLEIPDQQRQELEIVLAFDPTQAQANYDLGLLTLKDGDVAQAAEMFRISADNAPANVVEPQKELDKLGEADARLASARELREEEPKKALTEARIAAAIDPKNADAVRLVAQLWEAEKDPKRAQNAWERLLELVPGDPTATDAIKRLTTDAK
jgi:tetratricopeptide (TPR) repeat protein